MQGYLDQGNDLRHTRGDERHIEGPLGLAATVTATGEVTHYTRDLDGTVLASRTGEVTRFHIAEPNGHTAWITDVNGGSLGSYEYSPYGATTVIGGGVVEANPVRWLGSWQETGTLHGDDLYKLGARYYQTSGAFTQPDAIAGDLEDPRTLTAYNYAGGDPINYHDASGYSLGDIYDAANKGLSRLSTAASVVDIGYTAATEGLEAAVPGAAGFVAGAITGGVCGALIGGTGIGAAACGAASTAVGMATEEYVDSRM